jgi:ribosomal protein L7/L12
MEVRLFIETNSTPENMADTRADVRALMKLVGIHEAGSATDPNASVTAKELIADIENAEAVRIIKAVRLAKNCTLVEGKEWYERWIAPTDAFRTTQRNKYTGS